MVSSGLHTSTIACWAELDVCLLYGNFGGKNPKHKLWVEILTVSLVPWYPPCLTCTFHRGCFCIAYTALAQEIVALSLFALLFWLDCITRSLKNNSTLFSAFKKKFFFLLAQIPHRGLSHPALRDLAALEH